MTYAFFDVHSHLHDKVFDHDREAIAKEMKAYGLGSITVGTDLQESCAALHLAKQYENLYATVGLHPADNVTEKFEYDAFKSLALDPKVVAIGECGLDYHYLENFFERDKQQKNLTHTHEEEKKRQQEIFKQQIDFAVEVNKPLMLHGRPSKGSMDAYEDILTLLEEAKKIHGIKLRGNAHFFVGNIEIAKRFVDIGFSMSFSGVITFTKDYDDVVRFLPITMMHAETDSPYATPAPFRGKRNSPMYVQEVVAKIAVLRREPFEEVRVQLLENAKRFFDLTF
jgi:TatD DNase family protein